MPIVVFTYMKKEEIVYLVVDREKGTIYGCFKNKKDATRYGNDSKNIAVVSLTVQ